MQEMRGLLFCGIGVGCLGLLIGCSGTAAGNSDVSSVPLAGGGASAVYVYQPGIDVAVTGTVVQYPASTNGTASPIATLATPSTKANSYVAADPSGQLYVGIKADRPQVMIFAAGASGSVSPARTIVGSAASFSEPGPLAVDSTYQLYVVDQAGSISVYSRAASGAAIPVRHIQGALTRLADNAVPGAISVDAAGDIYVVMESTSVKVAAWTILVFSPSAMGDIAPAHTITVSNPCSLDNSSQVALDAKGRFYVACFEGGGSAIFEYSLNSSAIVTPEKIIGGSLTGLETVIALNVDDTGNIYALNYTPSTGLSVREFGASGSGNFAPAVQFKSGRMTSVFPQLVTR